MQALLVCQEKCVRQLPIDRMTDCKDLFELSSVEKSIPQDKSQRLCIMAIREARMCNRMRWLMLVPTASMTADSLTRSMLSPPMMVLLSSGKVVFWNEETHKLTMRSLDLQREVLEGDFDKTDLELRREISTASAAAASMCALSSRRICFVILASSMATLSTATSTTLTSSTTSSPATTVDDEGDWRWFWTFVLMVLATEWTLTGLARYWWHRLCEWLPRRQPAEPEEEPHGAHNMDVDEANLFSDDKVNDTVNDELAELRRLLAEREESLDS